VHVLYIEDHAATVFVLKEKYKALEIESAARLAEAKQKLAQEHFDILLVDLNLPDSKGLNTVKELVHYDVPIVILTGDSSSEFRAEAWRLGVADYIHKKELLDIDIAAKLKDAADNYERIKRRYSAISYRNLEAMKQYISCPPFAAISRSNAGHSAVA
jgi:DNA-binding response OmpR family regulator